MKAKSVCGHLGYIALLAFCGCGLEVGNPKKPGGGAPEELLLAVQDTESAAAQVDEALSAAQGEENTVANLQSGSNLVGANEVLLNSEPSPLVARRSGGLGIAGPSQCTEKEGAAVVTLSVSSSRESPWSQKRRSLKVQRTDSLEMQSTFSTHDEGVTIGCDAQTGRPVFPWETLQTVREETHILRRKSRQLDLPADLASRVARSKSEEREGNRVVELTRIENDGSYHLIRKVITSQWKHKLTLTGNAVATLESQVETPVPLEVVVERRAGVLVKKTLEKGTQISRRSDGTRTELTFADLVFTSNSRCTPDSGTIRGTFYATDGATVRDSFVLTFVDGAGTITFEKSGETAEYVDDCK